MGSVCCVPCRSSSSPYSRGNRSGDDVLPLSSGRDAGWEVEGGVWSMRFSSSSSSPATSGCVDKQELDEKKNEEGNLGRLWSVEGRNGREGNNSERDEFERHEEGCFSSSGSSPSSSSLGTIQSSRLGTIQSSSLRTIETSSLGTIQSSSLGTIESSRLGSIESSRLGTIETDANTVDFSSTGSFSNIALVGKENTTTGSCSSVSKKMHFISSFKDKNLSAASFDRTCHPGGPSSFSKFRSTGFLHKQNSHSLSLGEGSLEDGDWHSAPQKSHKSMRNKGWSMSAVSHLMTSSQKGFNEQLGLEEELALSSEKIHVVTTTPQRFDDSISQKCSICSRLLIQRSPWSMQKIIMLGNVDLPVVGVLVCGHVFHADCLEKEVPEPLKHDPSCPECDRQRSSQAAGRFNRLPVLGTLKAAGEPIMNKLSKIAPQMWRAPSRTAEVPPMTEGGMGSSSPGSFRERGFFHRSMPKKPTSTSSSSYQTKATRDPVSCSKKFSSSAQVSPASHL